MNFFDNIPNFSGQMQPMNNPMMNPSMMGNRYYPGMGNF